MPEERKENLLIAHIDALIKNLQRIDTLLKNNKIEKQFRAVYGKFSLATTPLRKDLAKLREKVQRSSLAEQELAEAWQIYAASQQDAQRVFAQCLDILGGMYVRTMELEEGICDLAEHLVRHYVRQTGIDWSSVMILGEERLFDNVAQTTQIIRLRFPEWDVWSLPFTAYEFGLLVTRGDNIRRLNEFFENEAKRIRGLITEEDIAPEGLSSDIQAYRREYQSNYKHDEEVEEFIQQQLLHMKTLFADAFATYFLGPAYLYARLYLRLLPTGVFRDRAHEPSLARRMYFMLKTLEKMNEAGKKDSFDSGPYRGEIQRLTALWTETVQAVRPGYKGEFQFGKPYDDWFSEMYDQLQRVYDDEGLSYAEWDQAKKLGEELLDSPQVLPRTPLPVILNAAWYCRVHHPERLLDIEKQVRALCKQAVSEGTLPPQAGPKAQV